MFNVTLLVKLLKRLVFYLVLYSEELKDKELDPTRGRMLYLAAKSYIGKDASPLDVASDELGCAESVSNIIRAVVSFRIITGTWTLWDTIRNDTRFMSVNLSPTAGDIVISPTSTGNGTIRGHVGIVGEGGTIISASSDSGKMEQNYTLESWEKRYHDYGGMPVYYYRLI